MCQQFIVSVYQEMNAREFNLLVYLIAHKPFCF